MRHNRNELGFTLIEAIVVTAVLGITAAMVFQASGKSEEASKRIHSSLKFEDIEGVFTNELVKILKDPSDTNCFTPTMFSKLLSAGISEFEMSPLEDVDIGVSRPVRTAIRDTSSVRNSITRCRSGRDIKDRSDSEDNVVHLCVRFSRDSSVHEGSFLNAEHAFAEIAVHLVDYNTSENISCSQFKSRTSAGSQVFYSIFWASDIAGDIRFNRKNGILHVGRAF